MQLDEKQLDQYIQDTFGPKDPVVNHYGDERDYYELAKLPDWFWDIIEAGAKNEETMLKVFLEQTLQRLFEFHHFFKYVAGSLTADAFLEHISKEESEDGLADLTSWVVSQGKEYYLDIWEHPEKIPPESDYLDSSQSFYNLALEAYERKTGRDMWKDYLNNK